MRRYNILNTEGLFNCLINMCFAVWAHHSLNIYGNFYHSFLLLFFYIIIIFYFNGSSLTDFFIFFCVMNLKQIQTKGIGDNAETGKTHRSGSEHRVQSPAEDRDPYTGCQRNTDNIIEKCPEEILVDISKRCTTEAYSSRYIT